MESEVGDLSTTRFVDMENNKIRFVFKENSNDQKIDTYSLMGSLPNNKITKLCIRVM